MFGDMLRLGLPAPDIDEHDGPQVVTTLGGQVVRDSWMRWLRQFDDPAVHQDLRLLMIVNTVVQHGWIDVVRAARRLQVSAGEAQDSLNRMVRIGFDGRAALQLVDGTPADADIALVLGRRALARLDELDALAGWRQERPSRKTVALDYAAARGRISTTELGSLVGANPTNVGGVLKSLADEGLLEPSRANRRGPGFYYRYVGPGSGSV
jgi:ATP-dependent DNA helicase RecG